MVLLFWKKNGIVLEYYTFLFFECLLYASWVWETEFNLSEIGFFVIFRQLLIDVNIKCLIITKVCLHIKKVKYNHYY